MPLLRPSSSVCYRLKLPELPTDCKTRKGGDVNVSEIAKKRLLLECRTGAAVDLSRSNIFVHGGLVIPLNLNEAQITTQSIQKELILYFAKQKNSSSSFKNLNDWISPEIFFLDLITRKWRLLETTIDPRANNSNIAGDDNNITMKERLFHAMCYSESTLYIFGGLIVSPTNGYELIASNELWKLDLTTKTWSLISKDPQISRRFNHSIQVQNSIDDSKDTKLLIIGGSDNMNHYINHVDIFNITKNCWETIPSPSYSTDNTANDSILTNIYGQFVPITQDRNFPLLIENNKAEIPTIAFYTPNCDEKKLKLRKAYSTRKNSDGIVVQSSRKSSSTSITSDGSPSDSERSIIPSPITALPLIPNSQGMRMNLSQERAMVEIPLNLKSPSGTHFKKGIIISGFYPTTEARDLHCYIYDLSSAYWTKFSVDCPDSDINHHRFWRLFGWKSHHRAILLGTEHDDHQSPSVQKFDYILSFRLALVNVLNEVPKNNNLLDHSNITPNISPSSSSDRLNVTMAPNSTSQFESYIKYVTTPLEIESTSSVFPPYAMVLGKDALEIFGKSISDFEFITSEGDSVSVPLYLLRKRWGRYFDYLLSKGYTKACEEYETCGTQSTLVKFQTNTDDRTSLNIDTQLETQPIPKRAMSTSPLDFQFNVNTYNESAPQRKSKPGSFSSHLSDEMEKLSPSTTRNEYYANEDIRKRHNLFDDFKNPNRKERITKHTANSTGGLVFRVPFQEDSELVGKESQSVDDVTDSSNKISKRRSSSAFGPVPEYGRRPSFVGSRRASHPVAFPAFAMNTLHSEKPSTYNRRKSSLRVLSSNHNSRRGSVLSQNSALSFVSSSSDRRGGSIHSQSRRSSNSLNNITNNLEFDMVNVAIPAVTEAPNISLPPTPTGSVLSLHPRRSSVTTRRSSQDQPSSPSVAASTHRSSSLPDISPFRRDTNPLADNRSLLSSRASSIGSGIQDKLDLEPLLTPRSLYMPWPTASIKAFAEFFYTGQVNGKWLLAPVVLDLLVMAHMYEIPLLYDMITEVLYTVIGKKEESLKISVTTVEEGFIETITRLYECDKVKSNAFLEESDIYSELSSLRKSLENINNGFLDIHLLQKFARSYSVTTNDDSVDDSEASTKLSTAELHDMMSSNTSKGMPDVIYAGGPRNSHNSVGSIKFPLTTNILYNRAGLGGQRQNSTTHTPLNIRKRSHLNKEFKSFSDEGDTMSPHTGHREKNHDDISSSLDELGEKLKQFKLRSTSGDNKIADDPYSAHENLLDKENSLVTPKEHEKPLFKKIYTHGTAMERDSSEGSSSSSSSGSQSDLETQPCTIGTLSASKIRKEVIKEEKLEESIDPLLKIGSNKQALNAIKKSIATINSKRTNSLHIKNSSTFQAGPSIERSSKDITSPIFGSEHSILNSDINQNNIFANPTLESIISLSSLPPVDYVIKSIFRTAVMVNDTRLMIRCMDCIEFSKVLKRLKKEIVKEFLRIHPTDNEILPSPTAMRNPKSFSTAITPVNSNISPLMSRVSPSTVAPPSPSINTNFAAMPSPLLKRGQSSGNVAQTTVIKGGQPPSLFRNNSGNTTIRDDSTMSGKNSNIQQQVSPRSSLSMNSLDDNNKSTITSQDNNDDSNINNKKVKNSSTLNSLPSTTSIHGKIASAAVAAHSSLFSYGGTSSPKSKKDGFPISSIDTTVDDNTTTAIRTPTNNGIKSDSKNNVSTNGASSSTSSTFSFFSKRKG